MPITTFFFGSSHFPFSVYSPTPSVHAFVQVTGSNVVSVAEHVVMQILALVRNFIPAYHQVREDVYGGLGCMFTCARSTIIYNINSSS